MIKAVNTECHRRCSRPAYLFAGGGERTAPGLEVSPGSMRVVSTAAMDEVADRR